MAPNLEPVSAIGFEIRVEMEISYQNMPKSRFCEKCKLNLSNTQLAMFMPDFHSWRLPRQNYTEN